MANIIPISPLANWFVKEEPTVAKFNSNIVDKVNTLIGNQDLINVQVTTLLPTTASGLPPANLLFALPNAPTGWTRNVSVINDGILLTSTTGLGSSGSWVMSGLSVSSVGDHTHTLGSHTHDATHNHVSSVHTHGMTHTHTAPGTHTHTISNDAQTTSASFRIIDSLAYTFNAGPGPAYSTNGHTHSLVHTHVVPSIALAPSTFSGSSNSTDATITQYSANTDSSTETLGLGGAHYHNIASNSVWRPQYLNMICCTKD